MSKSDTQQIQRLRIGMIYGMAGMLIFSLTLPMTILALPLMPPLPLTLARGLLAGLVAAAVLIASRSPLPEGRQYMRLILISLCLVLGFPLTIAYAMQHLPAGHGAVVLGILPLATSVVAVCITTERPNPGFWLIALAGCILVVVFALMQQDNLRLVWGDMLLLLAIASAAIGYAHSAKLAASMSGWRVICWALVIALPPLAVASWWLVPASAFVWPQGEMLYAWAGFFYVALFSQLTGFFFWNKGLYLGGIARVSQLQLLMPFATLFASALLLGEEITLQTLVFALLVIAVVVAGKHMRTGDRSCG